MKQISFMEKVINCVNDAVKEIKSIVTDYNDYGLDAKESIVFNVAVRKFDNDPYKLKSDGYYPLSENRKHSEDFCAIFTSETTLAVRNN